jgi:hypothetical protein
MEAWTLPAPILMDCRQLMLGALNFFSSLFFKSLNIMALLFIMRNMLIKYTFNLIKVIFSNKPSIIVENSKFPENLN